MEQEYDKKLEIFIKAIERLQPDVIALQEVMQPFDAEIITSHEGVVGEIPIKNGNHAANIVCGLSKLGVDYNLYWTGIKKSYDRYDEGVAILSKKQADNVCTITLSPFDDYYNWKTRKALAVMIGDCLFCTVHMGWWNDAQSPFQYEFNSLISGLPPCKQTWLMGDFNSIADERGKGYDMVLKSGFLDTYNLALTKDCGATADSHIDGWRKEEKKKRIRIDYIFTDQNEKINSSFTIFNGTNEQIVSDHFGIIVNVGKE